MEPSTVVGLVRRAGPRFSTFHHIETVRRPALGQRAPALADLIVQISVLNVWSRLNGSTRQLAGQWA